MNKVELMDMLDEYKAGLLSKATNGTMDNQYYTQTRNALMKEISIKDKIPQFIKSCRTAEAVAGGAYIDPVLQENPKLRDCRSDIYSIGAIWYWLLCGKAPQGSDMRSYLTNAVSNLSNEQIDIVMKCLAGNLENRYGNCGELLVAIN